MSHTEYHTGKAKKIVKKEGQTVEEIAKQIVEELHIKREDYQDTYVESLLEEKYEEYVIVDDEIYEIFDDRELDLDDNIYNAEKQDDGIIKYNVMFYNGSCPLSKAVELAIKKINFIEKNK